MDDPSMVHMQLYKDRAIKLNTDLIAWKAVVEGKLLFLTSQLFSYAVILVTASWDFWVPLPVLPQSLNLTVSFSKRVAKRHLSCSGAAGCFSVKCLEAFCWMQLCVLPASRKEGGAGCGSSNLLLWFCSISMPVFVAWVTSKGKAFLFFSLSVVSSTCFCSEAYIQQLSFSMAFSLCERNMTEKGMVIKIGGYALIQEFSLLPSWIISKKSA